MVHGRLSNRKRHQTNIRSVAGGRSTMWVAITQQTHALSRGLYVVGLLTFISLFGSYFFINLATDESIHSIQFFRSNDCSLDRWMIPHAETWKIIQLNSRGSPLSPKGQRCKKRGCLTIFGVRRKRSDVAPQLFSCPTLISAPLEIDNSWYSRFGSDEHLIFTQLCSSVAFQSYIAEFFADWTTVRIWIWLFVG